MKSSEGDGGHGQGHRWWGRCLEMCRRRAGARSLAQGRWGGHLASRWWGEVLRIISVF